MEGSKPQRTRIAWRLLLAGIGPFSLLFAYLFLFRWPGRALVTTGDYTAVIVCSLAGTIMMAMQPVQIWLRGIAILFHIALSMALFGWWRLLSRPVLNDIF
jgi:hypothetical protein